MTHHDDIRTEAEATPGEPRSARQPATERQTIASQPPRADSAEAQPDRPQHEYALDAVGGEPSEPTLEDIRSPERDSGELDETAAGRLRGLRDERREPARDEFTKRADPPDGDGPP